MKVSDLPEFPKVDHSATIVFLASMPPYVPPTGNDLLREIRDQLVNNTLYTDDYRDRVRDAFAAVAP